MAQVPDVPRGCSTSERTSAAPVSAARDDCRALDWHALRDEDYSYRASTGTTGLAQLTTPAPGAEFASTNVTFGWSAGSNVSEYALYVGTSDVGSYDLYSALVGTRLTGSVTGLPGDGRPIFVRLWSCIGGQWQYNDYIYKATTGGAELTTPAPRSTLTSSSETFAWTVSGGVSRVALYVGVGGPGSYDVFSGIRDGSGSATVSGLPTHGETVYVRLWSFDGVWQYGDYTYTATK